MTNELTVTETEKKPLLFSNFDLKKLIIPLIFETFLSTSLGMIDTIMVSGIGEAAVSGVSLVDMLCILIINVFSSMATAGAIVTSQFIGSKDRNRAGVSAFQLILVALVSSVGLMIPVMIFRKQFLLLMFRQIETDVMDAALTYIFINAISFPFIAIYSACAAIFRAMGNSKISMYSSLVINIVNIGGNAALIYGLKMGVMGAAISTVASRFIAMVFLLIVLTNKKNYIYLDIRNAKPDFQIIKKILYIGIPGSLEGGMFQLGRLLVISIITAFGTVQIAANAVANNLDCLGIIPGQALGIAIVTIVGRCVGADDYAQAKFYIKKLMKITYIATAVTNVLIAVTLPLSLKLYDLSAETLKLASTLVLIHTVCAIILWPASFTLPNAMRAAGDIKFIMVLSILSMWIFRILFSYFLGMYLGWGAIGVWWAMVFDWICRVTMLLLRYRSGKWQKGKIV